MTVGEPGVEIAIEYNAANNRLTQASWILLAGYVARVQIWNNGVPAVDRSVSGPSTGAETIPGNLRMVWVANPEVPGGGYYDLPGQLTWRLNIETIGA
jgi:hypothetical protein